MAELQSLQSGPGGPDRTKVGHGPLLRSNSLQGREEESGPGQGRRKAPKTKKALAAGPFTDYLEHLQRIGTKRAGFTLSRRHLGLYSDYLGEEDPLSVRIPVAEGFLRFLSSCGREFSTGYLLNVIKTVKAFYRYHIEEGRCSSDPFTYVELPKQKSKLPRGVPTDREVRLVLAAIPREAYRDRAIVEVLYGSGLRLSELIALEVEDLDLEEQKVRVADAKTRVERWIPLSGHSVHALALYLQRARGELFGRPPLSHLEEDRRESDRRRLFVKPGGFPLCPWLVGTLISRYGREAGVKKRLTAHSFRHGCATEMLKGGASIRHVQRMLGHRSISSTMVYTRLGLEDLKTALEKLHPHGRAGRR